MAEIDMNKSGIYKITNLVNGHIYIGSAVIFRKRRDLHNLELKNNKHHSRYLQNAWNKYSGWNFKFEIIEIVEDKIKLIEREQYYIDMLKPEYNICLIAESRLGVKSSPEHIAKIVAANTGQKRSKETKEKLRQNRLGKKFTEKQRLNLKNRPAVTKATKDKISIARTGFIHTEEAKLKMSAEAKNRIRKPLSDETKAKLSIRAKAQWHNKSEIIILNIGV